MHIDFDTESLKLDEARGLIALLSSLFPTSEQIDFNRLPQAPGIAANLGAAALLGHIKYADQLAAEAAALLGHIKYADQLAAEAASQPVPNSVPNPTPTPAVNQPAAEPGPAVTRHRRTKAEIAADEAAAKNAEQAQPQATPSDPTPASAAPAAAASGTTQSATAEPSTAPVSADDLRALLNGYIAKHSMEEAIGQLQNFGCNRVTEALALDPVKLNALAEALHG